MTTPRIWMAIAVVLMSAAAHAQTRTYVGPMSTNWKTIGPHGHDQPPCAEERTTHLPRGGILTESPDCNGVDFARGNLDNSIGFRGGRERDIFRLGRLSIVGGMEGALSYTEYNLTQTDFIFASANVIGGADLRLGPIVVGGRIGAGSFATTDGNEYGFQHIRGAHITVPLRPGAAIRVSRQQMQVFGSQKELDVYGDGPVMLLPPAANEPTVVTREPKAIETSILLITSPEYIGSTKWQFSAATGTTSPGGPIGSSRMLRASAFSQISAFRDIPWYGLEGRVTWTTSAHESVLPTVFLGYDGNFRSKTIDGFGLGVSRTTGRLFEHFSVRYGSGVEVADWRDEHQLLTRDGKELRAGIEAGIGVDVGVRWHFGRNLAFETSFEKVYWPAIDLGEFRTGFGLVITR